MTQITEIANTTMNAVQLLAVIVVTIGAWLASMGYLSKTRAEKLTAIGRMVVQSTEQIHKLTGFGNITGSQLKQLALDKFDDLMPDATVAEKHTAIESAVQALPSSSATFGPSSISAAAPIKATVNPMPAALAGMAQTITTDLSNGTTINGKEVLVSGVTALLHQLAESHPEILDDPIGALSRLQINLNPHIGEKRGKS